MDPRPPAASTLGVPDTREQEMPDTAWDSGKSRRGGNRAVVAGCFLAAAAAATVGVALLTSGDDTPRAAPGPPSPGTGRA